MKQQNIVDPNSAEHVASKIVRYRNNFRAFATEQLKLNGSPINFWPCQVPLIESVERQFEEKGFARCVWLKARQVGASTLAQCFVAWRAMLWPNVNALVLADESERARGLFEIVRSFYDQMDDDIRPVGRYVTKRELVFANPSHITRTSDPGLRSRVVIESAAKKNIAIGAAWTIALLSECARYRDPNFVIDGVFPAVHRIPGTIIIAESSAEMAGTWYRDFFEDSRKGLTGFEAMFTPWILQPEYQIPLRKNEKLDYTADERAVIREYGLRPEHVKWMREKLAEMNNNQDLFRQNFPLCAEEAWVTPGSQVFPSSKLRELREGIQPPRRRCEIYPGPRILDHPTGRLNIWKDPERGKAYDIGCDVASGLGKDDDASDEYLDNSVICVLERGSNDQVAEWVSKAVDPFELAQMLYWLGIYYNQAQIAVETNGIGASTNAQLAKLGCGNIYLWRFRDEIVPRYSRKTGWESNPRSKPWLIGFALHEVMSSRVIVRSESLLKEMESFVQSNVREWGAVAGAKDDRVTAWMISLLISDDENFERYYGLVKSTDAQKISNEKVRIPEPWECDMNFKNIGREADFDPWR